nr:Uncharacterised protein [Escherichia coli]
MSRSASSPRKAVLLAGVVLRKPTAHYRFSGVDFACEICVFFSSEHRPFFQVPAIVWPPCRYCSRAASNARVRSAGVLTRSQFISKALSAVFPSFSVSIFAVKPSSQRLLFFTALRLAAPPLHSPLFARLSYRHGVTGAAFEKGELPCPDLSG